jgi:hypothetical protein
MSGQWFECLALPSEVRPCAISKRQCHGVHDAASRVADVGHLSVTHRLTPTGSFLHVERPGVLGQRQSGHARRGCCNCRTHVESTATTVERLERRPSNGLSEREHLVAATPCPRCKRLRSVSSIEDSPVTYYFCDGCYTGWSADRRDPMGSLGPTFTKAPSKKLKGRGSGRHRDG